ncbi:MAG TPA: helix-turn-helix domain-containing protein [Chloroflexota bacterium]|nr:helix-turn-helix domain-containing protein [Chloroflexota bacterium]
MGCHAQAIDLTAEERQELDRRIRARTSSQQAALRARIVVQASEGVSNTAIATRLGIARHTVLHWRNRFAAQHLDGLVDRPHHPPPRLYDAAIQAKIVTLACQKPADLGWKGQTHWSIVDLATYIGEHPALELGTPKKSTIGTILQAAKLRLDRL